MKSSGQAEKMASFSDDETFEIDTILDERKRKGILHYLVQWKEGDASWEPAERISADCTAAVQFFKKTKAKTQRSSSKSRKSSRSRSRSSSRSRKGASKAVRKSSRSRSRGRQTAETKKEESVQVTTIQTRRSLQRKDTGSETKVEAEVKVIETISTPLATPPSTSSVSVNTSSLQEDKQMDKAETPSGRTLRSSTMEAKKNLEVQRVHNEQRPVRDDDDKPRSAIWKIADYAVIVLFVISALAALFMFLEKFMDLENFKKQAFPSFETLSVRLQTGKDHLVDMFSFGLKRSSDAWDYVLSQVKQPEKGQSVPAK